MLGFGGIFEDVCKVEGVGFILRLGWMEFRGCRVLLEV